MPLNPPKELTKAEVARVWAARAQDRTEGYFYKHAPVTAAFLAGIILGYVVGAR